MSGFRAETDHWWMAYTRPVNAVAGLALLAAACAPRHPAAEVPLSTPIESGLTQPDRARSLPATRVPERTQQVLQTFDASGVVVTLPKEEGITAKLRFSGTSKGINSGTGSYTVEFAPGTLKTDVYYQQKVPDPLYDFLMDTAFIIEGRTRTLFVMFNAASASRRQDRFGVTIFVNGFDGSQPTTVKIEWRDWQLPTTVTVNGVEKATGPIGGK